MEARYAGNMQRAGKVARERPNIRLASGDHNKSNNNSNWAAGTSLEAAWPPRRVTDWAPLLQEGARSKWKTRVRAN